MESKQPQPRTQFLFIDPDIGEQFGVYFTDPLEAERVHVALTEGRYKNLIGQGIESRFSIRMKLLPGETKWMPI